MREGLSGKLSLDTRALIELLYSTPAGTVLREKLKQGQVEASTTELNVAELRYVLCRKLGPKEAAERAEKLLASGYVAVENLSTLIVNASELKCQRAISLADCFCIALAHKNSSKALFATRERDLANEMRKEPFETEIVFLEDHS